MFEGPEIRRLGGAVSVRYRASTEEELFEGLSPHVTHAGLFVPTEEPAEEESRVRLEFAILGTGEVVEAEGKVSRVQLPESGPGAPPAGMRLKFTRLEGRVRTLVYEILQFERRRASRPGMRPVGQRPQPAGPGVADDPPSRPTPVIPTPAPVLAHEREPSVDSVDVDLGFDVTEEPEPELDLVADLLASPTPKPIEPSSEPRAKGPSGPRVPAAATNASPRQPAASATSGSPRQPAASATSGPAASPLTPPPSASPAPGAWPAASPAPAPGAWPAASPSPAPAAWPGASASPAASPFPPGAMPGPADPTPHLTPLPAATEAAPGARPRGGRAWVIPLVASLGGAVAAAAAVAIVLYVTRPEPPPPAPPPPGAQFILVQGEVVAEGNETIMVTPASADAGPDGAAADGGARPAGPRRPRRPGGEPARSPDGGAVEDAAPAAGGAAPPRAGAGPEAAFARQSGRIAACFEEHALDVEGLPQLAVEFSVERDGAVQRATVHPSSVRGTPLGACIAEVARSTRFGPQRGAVQFRIPIRARRAE